MEEGGVLFYEEKEFLGFRDRHCHSGGTAIHAPVFLFHDRPAYGGTAGDPSSIFVSML